MTLLQADVLSAYDACGFSRVTVSLVLNAVGIPSSDKRAVNLVDINGETALHYAARHGYVSSIELLLNAGADLSIKNVFGHTAADLAQMQGWNKMEQLLTATAAQLSPSQELELNVAAHSPGLEIDMRPQGSNPAHHDREGARSSGGWLPSLDPAEESEKACDSSAHAHDGEDSSSATEFPPELLNGLNTNECTSVDYLDWAQFQQEYQALSRPVLVRQPQVGRSERDGWHVSDRWQRSALRGHYGSIRVSQLPFQQTNRASRGTIVSRSC